MSNELYLFLVYSLIPLGVIVIALLGQPLLTLPQRIVPGLSLDGARALSVTILASLGTALEMFLAFRLIPGD